MLFNRYKGVFSLNVRSFLSIVFSISLVISLGSNMYLPALPSLGKFFAINDSDTQLTMSVYLLGASITPLIFGAISDYNGRKSMILSGMFIFLLGSIICMSATFFSFFILGRFIQGIGASAVSSLSRTILKDSFSGNELSKASSYNGIALAIGISISPIIGGMLQSWIGWQEIFFFMTTYAAFVILIVHIYLPETNLTPIQSITFKKLMQNYKNIAFDSLFLANTFCASIAMAGIYVFYTISPYLFEQKFGFSVIEYSMISLFITIALIIGRLANFPLLSRFQWSGTLMIGNLLMVLSGLLLLLSVSFLPGGILQIMIPISIFTIGAGFIFSNSIVGALYNLGHIAGAAGAMYGFIQMGLSALINFICVKLEIDLELLLSFLFIFSGLSNVVVYYFFSYRKLYTLGVNV